MPSDYSGVLFKPTPASCSSRWTSAGLWKYALAKEIQAAGIPVDLNRLLSARPRGHEAQSN